MCKKLSQMRTIINEIKKCYLSKIFTNINSKTKIDMKIFNKNIDNYIIEFELYIIY